MPVNVKLNRGPAQGKVVSIDEQAHSGGIILWAKPKPFRITSALNPDDYFSPVFEEHEYRRSHRVQRNGTVIYEWMGKTRG